MSTGITLDAESVRQRLRDAYTEKAQKAADEYTDDEINNVINVQAARLFWEVYDDTRADVIDWLLRDQGLIPIDERTDR